MASAGFEWERLPSDLQQSILLRLPISTLLLCKSLSRSFLHTIRSSSSLSAYSSLHRQRRSRHREDILLLLFADHGREGLAAAYLPSCPRWLPLPLPCSFSCIHASDGGVVVTSTNDFFGEYVVSDLFSQTLIPILPPLPLSYILALIGDDVSSDFKIVTLGNHKSAWNALIGYRVSSPVYDSRSCQWELKGQLPGYCIILGKSVFFDGLLFVLVYLPNRLLTFDLDDVEWSAVDVALPSLLASIGLQGEVVFGWRPGRGCEGGSGKGCSSCKNQNLGTRFSGEGTAGILLYARQCFSRI